MDFFANPNNAWIWNAAQTILVAFGFLFVVKQLKLARVQNSISHLNFFRELWNSKPILRARLAVVDETLDENIDFNAAEDVLATFMQDLGVAVAAGQASKSHVWSYFSYYVEGYWLLLKPKVDYYREKTSDPNYFRNFGDIYSHSLRISRSKGSRSMPQSYLDSFRVEERIVCHFLLEE